MSPAERAYAAIKRAAKKYYETHKEDILKKSAEKYRAKNPNPKPVGRPRKEVEEVKPVKRKLRIVE